MKSDKHTDTQTLEGAAVGQIDTIPRKVSYQDREVTDKWWGLFYVLSYVGYLSCGFFLVSQAHPKYILDANGERSINDYHLEDIDQCCKETAGKGGVCFNFDDDGYGDGQRNLQAGNSKFNGDEGIFDAFLEAPEIIVVLSLLTLAISVVWIVLLRFFAKTIVIITEVAKVALLIYLAIYLDAGVFFFFAAASLGYSVYARNKLSFAAKIISLSSKSMKENPSILTGALITKLLYTGNAALFVIFFSETFNVVEVGKGSYDYCDFTYPSYAYHISIYLSISYAWTILFLDSARLSIIATIVGSWHFHPEDKPGIIAAIKNFGPSIGTISICSFIATIAEKIRQWFLCDSLSSFNLMMCLCLPLQPLAFIFSGAIRVFVSTFTKFSLILHVFVGDGFLGSSRSVYKILSRHFKSGFVTEITSRSVLYLASYAFSLAIAMIAWVWISERFDCDSIPDLGVFWFMCFLLVILFNLYNPVLGLYLIIFVNSSIQQWEKQTLQDDSTVTENYNHMWIPPIAASFVGCLAMMMFSFLSAVFLDIIDTLFLCFAIDKDANIDTSTDEFSALVKEMPDYIHVGVQVVMDPEIDIPSSPIHSGVPAVPVTQYDA